MHRSPFSFLVPCLLANTASAQDLDLGRTFAAVVDAPLFRQATWGLLVVDAKTGAVVHERDADKLFAPASTTKLFSTAAALTALGPDAGFTTRIVRHGEVDANGALRGDLILVAAGDPTLGGRTLPDGSLAYAASDHTYANGNERGALTSPDPLTGLRSLAKQVAAAGIRSFTGELLVDDRLFDAEASTGSGPRRLSAIVVNDNLVDVLVTPGAAGSPATVTVRPPSAALVVDAQVTTAPKGTKAAVEVRAVGPLRIVVRGTLAEGHAPLLRTQEIEDPASFARTLMLECLAEAGVRSQASTLDFARRDLLPPSKEVAALPTVASFASAPLIEHVKLILKVSHNQHASMLPLLLAAHAGKRGLVEGLRAERAALESLGVPTATISFGGGAGGSPSDRTTPRATVALLHGIAKQPFGAAFRAALPVLGVDGTLASAVPATSPARGKAQAKTGTYYYDNPMNGTFVLTSKAIAGWLTARSGRELLFCFVVNGVHLAQESDADKIGMELGRLCELAFEAL